MSDTNDTAALLADLAAARKELADTVAKARRRQRTSAVLSVLSLVLIAAYLIFGYRTYGGGVTPDVVIANAANAARGQMPAAQAALEKNLKEQAPALVDKAFKQVTAMPDQYAAKLQAEATKRMDAALPDVQAQMYTAMKTALDKSVAANAAGGGPGAKTDDDRLRATLAAVAAVYAHDTTQFVTRTHDTYWSGTNGFLEYMDRLASSPNLDRRDQMYKEMFQTVFALIRERDAAAATPTGNGKS